MHALILHGIDRANAGRYRDIGVEILGSRHRPPLPAIVDSLMGELFEFYEASKATMHPVELAAQMHERLVTVHPFTDGNGRTARLMMNLILLRGGYPITVLPSDPAQRQLYFRTLEAVQISPERDNSPFQRFVAEHVHSWLLRYLDLVSVDVSLAAKDKGGAFFKAIGPSLQHTP